MEPEGDFVLATMLEREDPRDAWVSNDAGSLSELPIGASIGTSSLRREAQLRAMRPDIEVLPLRGNLDTRMSKLDRGDFQAIILAAAGLKRLGLASRVRSYIEPEVCLPAPGQGTLGIEILSERKDLARWLAPLTHAGSLAAALAERQVSRRLGGSCEIPLAAYAEIEGQALFLRALVWKGVRPA
jgi:hydroxymethylbilane synthase